MLVYDDEHRAGAALKGDPRWLRFKPEPEEAGSWVERTPGQFVERLRRRSLDRRALPPRGSQPGRLEGNPGQTRPCRGRRRAILITDFNSYNTDVLADDEKSAQKSGPPVVPAPLGRRFDMSLRLKVLEATGGVRLELIESGVSNRCEIDLTDRPGDALSRRIHAGGGRFRPKLAAAGRFRAHLRQRRRPADALGRWKAAVRRGLGPLRPIEGPSRRPPPTRAGPRRVAAGGDRGRRADAQARRILHARAGRMRLRELSMYPLDRFHGVFRSSFKSNAFRSLEHRQARDYCWDLGAT